MTVKEAIEKLKKLPPDTKLTVCIAPEHAVGDQSGASWFEIDDITPGADEEKESDIQLGGLVRG